MSAPNGRTFAVAPEILSALRQGRQARLAREVQGGAAAPPVNQPPCGVAEPIGERSETIGVVDLPQNMPQVPSDVGGAEMSQMAEKKLTKKRVRKRWEGLDSIQIRLRVPGHLADRMGSISLKQKARLVAFLLSAKALQIDLEALSSDGLRGELIRVGCNLNQAIRLLHRGEGESANLVTEVEAALSWLARLRKAGCL